MGRHVDYTKFDIEQLEDEDFKDANGGFEKIGRKRKFDDGTVPTKTGRKKQKVQRGGKDEIPEDDDND